MCVICTLQVGLSLSSALPEGTRVLGAVISQIPAACRTSPGTAKAGLGKGAIIGIVIGVICALGVLAGVLAFLLLPHRRRAQQGWQKETLDGQRTMPKQNVELASASGLA